MRSILIFVGILAGCAFATTPHREAVPQPEDRISGAWQLRLVPDRGTAYAVTGRLALVPRLKAETDMMWSNLPDPTHLGVYAVDLRPLNVTQELEGPIPHAGAKSLGGDSVLVVLNPAPDHGAVVLRGVVSADSVTGTWVVTSYGIGAHGQFVMWRQPQGN